MSMRKKICSCPIGRNSRGNFYSYKNNSRRRYNNFFVDKNRCEKVRLTGGAMGDTKVSLTDNRSITVLELLKEYNLGKDNYCFSLDNDSNVVITKITRPVQIDQTSKLIKITLDNNEMIFCDLHCNFLTRDKTAIKSIDLVNNQPLAPLYIDYAKNIPISQRSYKDKRIKMEAYLVVYNLKTSLYDYIHFLADDYNLRNGVYTKENGTVRHHDDLNKYNNNPPNIKRKDRLEHFKIHSEFASERAKKGEIGWGRAHELHPEFYSKMASENMTKLHQDQEFQERHSARASENIKDYLNSNEFYEMTRKAGQRGKEYLIKYNKSKKGRKKSSEIGREGKMKCQECGQEVFGRAEMIKHYKINHPDVWAQNQSAFQNAALEYVRSEAGRKIQSERAKSGQMECRKCGEIVRGTSELRKHYAEKHHNFMLCPFCGRSCKGKGD